MVTVVQLKPGELLARAGIAEDVLTFWTRRGLVLPLNPDREHKKRRMFAFYEANVAAVMRELRRLGTDIEGLLSVAAIYREAIGWGAELGASRDDALAMWTVFERDGAQRVEPRIVAMAAQTEQATFQRHLHTFLSIMDQPVARPGAQELQPEISYFWRAGDRWRLEIGEEAPAKAWGDGSMATIAINVPEVIYRVWNPS